MEGRRYAKDCASVRTFLDLMRSETGRVNPDYILTEGNHEERLWRYLERDPLFEDTADYRRDCGFEDMGFRIIPYKKFFKHKGIEFTHVPISEAGKPLGGKYVCNRTLDVCTSTVVFGHTHKLGVAGLHRHGSAHLQQAINVGCYFEHVDDYALGSVTSYWRGLVLIDHYKPRACNFYPIRMSTLRRKYEQETKS